MVKLMGTIHNVQEHSTNVVFVLNDGSHSIECKFWLDRDNGGEATISNIKYGPGFLFPLGCFHS